MYLRIRNVIKYPKFTQDGIRLKCTKQLCHCDLVWHYTWRGITSFILLTNYSITFHNWLSTLNEKCTLVRAILKCIWNVLHMDSGISTAVYLMTANNCLLLHTFQSGAMCSWPHHNSSSWEPPISLLVVAFQLQWKLSVTTTSVIKFISCDLFSNVLNEDWRYQFTLANNFCFLELM